MRDQIAHLAASEDWARRSLTDPDTFRADLAALSEDAGRRAAEVASGLLGCRVPEAGALAWWRAERERDDCRAPVRASRATGSRGSAPTCR